MKKWLSFIFTFIFIFSITFPHTYAQWDEEQYLVIFKDEVDVTVIEQFGGEINQKYDFMPAVAASFPSNYLPILANHPAIQLIEHDGEVVVQQQITDWGVNRVNAQRAWNSGITGQGIKVGVIDTGIAANHPDLNVRGGISTVSYTSLYDDDNGHGTHAAGIIAAKNNSFGVIGVAYDAEIYAIKALDKDGSGRVSDVIAGIEWAMQNKLDIINLSFGTPQHSTVFEQVINKAYDQGILIVAAAGNSGHQHGNGDQVEYPARYDKVIAVAATDTQNRRAHFSAVGSTIEFAAPGVNINSTYLNNGYKGWSGTSMAAPFVAGVLALLKEANPRASHIELRQMLRASAIDLGPAGRDPHFGFGLVQAPDKKAVYPPPAAPTEVKSSVVYVSDNQAAVEISWKKVTGSIKHYRVYRNNQFVATVKSGNIFKETVPVGSYTYRVSAVDDYGVESALSTGVTVVIVEQPKAEDPPPNVGGSDGGGSKQETPDRNTINFTDVSNEHWATKEIHYLAGFEIIGGYSDGTFRPGEPIRRGQAVAMIARHLNLDGTKRATSFSDVREDYFASGYIQSAHDARILGGFSDGTFRPNAPITRAQMAMILARAYELEGRGEASFSDVTANTQGREAINLLASLGIAGGFSDGTYRPGADVSRAHFSVFLTRTVEPSFRLVR